MMSGGIKEPAITIHHEEAGAKTVWGKFIKTRRSKDRKINLSVRSA